MENYFQNKANNDQSIFKSLIFRYLPYWPIFIAFFILFSFAGWIYLKITPPKYVSTASVLLKDEKKGVDDSRMIESLNIYSSKKIVENEIEVIKSKTLLYETIKNLNLCVPIYSHGLFFYKSAFSNSPLKIVLHDIKNLKETQNIPFYFEKEKDSVFVFNTCYKVGEWINSPYGKLKFEENVFSESPRNGPFYFSIIDPRKILNQLYASIDVVPVSKLSTVVNLSIIDSDYKRGESVLDALIEVYRLASLTEKNILAKNTLEFIEERVRMIERQLDSVELKVQTYKSGKGIVDLSEQSKLYLQNVGENDMKASELNMQLAVLDKVENYVKEKNNQGGLVPSTLGINDISLNQLLEKLYIAELDYEKLSKTTPANNLIMVSLKREIDQIRPRVLENIQNQRQSIEAGLVNLANTNKVFNKKMIDIPQKERDLLEINRQHLIKNNVYTFLLQKREETALAYASTVADCRIIDHANSAFLPVSPNRTIVYGFGILLSIFLGVVWVAIKELLGNKVLFRTQIEEKTVLPIVGQISHAKTRRPIIVDQSKHRYLAEQFRQLRAAVGLYGKKDRKILLITSSIPGEGKSFVSANLAVSLALANKKVVLIDFDLRSSKLSRLFTSEDKKGVSDYLNGDAEVDQIKQNTQYSNLFFIGAGTQIENPTESLLIGNLKGFFERISEEFDYVIVDTSPVDPVSDAFFLANYCHSTLFVIRHGKTPIDILKRIPITELSNICIVFNDVKSRGFFKNDYEYGYGRGNKYYLKHEFKYPKANVTKDRF